MAVKCCDCERKIGMVEKKHSANGKTVCWDCFIKKYFTPTRWSSDDLMFDQNRRLLLINNKIYSYDQLVGYDLFVNEEMITRSSGWMAKEQKTTKNFRSAAIRIALRGSIAGTETVRVTGSMSDVDRCISALELVLDEIKSGKSEETSQGTISAADEILKFKQLLDQGIITESEFEAKKKQLLGI